MQGNLNKVYELILDKKQAIGKLLDSSSELVSEARTALELNPRPQIELSLKKALGVFKNAMKQKEELDVKNNGTNSLQSSAETLGQYSRIYSDLTWSVVVIKNTLTKIRIEKDEGVEHTSTSKPKAITDENIIAFIWSHFPGIEFDGDVVMIKGHRYFISVRDNVLVRC